MAKLKSTTIEGSLVASEAITSLKPGATLSTIGTVSLSDDTNSTSTTEAATPNAVKKVVDMVNGKEPSFKKNTAFNKNYETDSSKYKAAGTASAGTLDTVSKADHIHPPQTSVSGNAGTATKLQTQRKITLSGDAVGQVGFDGSKDESLLVEVVDDSHNHSVLIGRSGGGAILKDYGNGNVTVSASKDGNGAIGDLYLGYNTSANFTRNIRLESPVNWKGGSTYIIDSNGKVDWNALKNIPTPLTFGALPITGGTMKGEIQMDNNAVRLTTAESGHSRIGYDTSTGDTYVSSANNNWLRIKKDLKLSIGGKKIYSEVEKPTAADVGALSLGGGSLTGSISSSVSSGTYLSANTGKAIINSTASGTGFNMLAKMNSTNGAWTFGSYGTNFNLYYTAKSIIDASTNGSSKSLTLLNESGNSIFPGEISAQKAKIGSDGATPLTIKRDGSSANVNLCFDAGGTISYLGTPKGELKFGTSEDLGGSGKTVWHAGNFNPDSKVNINGENSVDSNWKAKVGGSLMGFGLYGGSNVGIATNGTAMFGGSSIWIKYNNYDSGGDKFYKNERAHQVYGDNLSFRIKSSNAIGAADKGITWTNATHMAGVVWSSADPSSSNTNYPIGTIWIRY